MNPYITMRPGKYSNPLTWIGNQVPLIDSMVTINHTVTLDTSISTCGLMLNATLTLDPTKSITLSNCGRLEGHAKLISKPIAAVVHLIQQHGVIEANYTGNNDTDDGIYIMTGWELQGSPRTSWCRLLVGAKKGDTVIKLDRSPVAWKQDELWIAPTVRGDYEGELVRISSVRGSVITLAAPLQHDYPANRQHTAEVINLTSNMRIEGFPGARGHIMYMGGVQKISNVAIRYMGVPGVKGRYSNHLHLNGDSSRGSIFTRVISRDSGNKGFVTHASHGASYNNCVVLDSIGPGYWDDPPLAPRDATNNTNDLLYDNCIAAMTRPGDSPYSLPSFQLGSGTGNIIKNCVAICNLGAEGSAGFLWGSEDNYNENLWVSTGLLSHNMRTCGLRSWQNDPNLHAPVNVVAYNCLIGIQHGAYDNNYQYSGFDLFNNDTDIELHALSKTGMSFTDGVCSGSLVIKPHTLPSAVPVLFLRCKFSSVVVADLRNGIAGKYDFVECSPLFDIVSMEPGSIIRVQDGANAMQYSGGIWKTIDKFFML